MGNWDMKRGAIDLHHRELQANMSQDTVTSRMHHLLTEFRVFTTCRLKSGFVDKWRMCNVIMCYDICLASVMIAYFYICAQQFGRVRTEN